MCGHSERTIVLKVPGCNIEGAGVRQNFFQAKKGADKVNPKGYCIGELSLVRQNYCIDYMDNAIAGFDICCDDVGVVYHDTVCGINANCATLHTINL